MKAMQLLTQGEDVLLHDESDVFEDALEFQPTYDENIKAKSKQEQEGLERAIKMPSISGEFQSLSNNVRLITFHILYVIDKINFL